jgi:Clp amino terminal domain, pathogenicity island component
MAPPAAYSLQDVIQRVETEADDSPLGRLQLASATVRELAEIGDAVLGYFVDQARHAGCSWSEIGDSLGVSKQAAQQRHTVRMSLGLNAPTFERFTPRARNVLNQAEPIARAWGHGAVGTEHLFLALYREPGGVAAVVLADAGLPEATAEASIGARSAPGPGAPDTKLPYTPGVNAAFSGALAAALELGHSYIGTEHLLLGLARESGLAADVLTDHGLGYAELVSKVTEKLAGFSAWVGGSESPAGKPGPEPASGENAAGPDKRAGSKRPRP